MLIKIIATAIIIIASILSGESSEPQYLVTFELSQVNYTIDLEIHFRNEMNRVQFEIPVSYEYYSSLKVGQLVVDRFRKGSIIVHGSLGKWKMKVINKRILHERGLK